jgi:Plasmid pRiA4b ORF-3-like protein
MKEYKLTDLHEQCLRDQVFSADKPGSVLGDFQRLLDFLGTDRVESSGKYNLLPIKLIGELDGLLYHPLDLDLKRPQIRSHPYLHGLNLLLRASGLVRVDGAGSKAWLVVDPEMKVQWDALNPTERYFNLLEAWLLIGRAEMVGAESSRLDDLLSKCLRGWQALSRAEHRSEGDDFEVIYLTGFGRDFYLVALLDLFGLAEVKHPPRPIKQWYPAGVKLLPFGDAIFRLLAHGIDHPMCRVYALLDDVNEAGLSDVEEEGEDENEDEDDDEFASEDEDEDDWGEPSFGTWQPLFQPYFPEWRQNLTLPEREPFKGTLVFRVSLGTVWRLIAMPADRTLEDLVGWVLRSVKFDHDHLYKFVYRDSLGRVIQVRDPRAEEGPWSDSVSLGTLPLKLGDSMNLLYDFGDSWHFTIKLERVEPPGARIKTPSILEKHGKAPKQYPDWDE